MRAEGKTEADGHISISLEAEIPGDKLQIPNTKLQRSAKLRVQKPTDAPRKGSVPGRGQFHLSKLWKEVGSPFARVNS